MDQELGLLLKYPLMEKKSTDNSHVVLFEGQICVNYQDFQIQIEQTSTVDQQATFKIKTLFHNNKPYLIDELNASLSKNNHQTILEYLDEIKNYLEQNYSVQSHVDHCDIYRQVLYEYSEFTKFFLNLKTCKLKEDLTKIWVSFSDEKLREHSIEISINYSKKTPNIFEISCYDLPLKEPNKTDMFKSNDSLNSLFDQFVSQVELLQPYFDIMEEFDNNCTILDPENPKRQHAYRRVWLGENVSAIILFDAYNIFQRPDVRFLGPDRLTEPYTTHLNENLSKWVCQNDIFQGVLDILGLKEFPKKLETVKEINMLVEYGECSICFSLRLNDKLPEIICPNKSCELFYHSQCLYDWLVSINSKRIFNKISGNCPNCEKTISCPVLD